MDLERGLKNWVDAGLIDSGAADAIRAYEARARRPWGRWSIIALGLLAVALGVALLIAANWWTIPDSLKIAVHLALTAGVAWAVFEADRRQWRWSREAALFLLGALVLGGIALQTQVFQLSGKSWQALWLWLVLMGPAMMLLAMSRLNALGYSAMAGWAALALGTDGYGHIGQGIALAVPAGLLALSAIRDDARIAYARGLREAGLAFMLGGASIAHLAWSVDLGMSEIAPWRLPLCIGVVLSALALGCLWKLGDPKRAIIVPCGIAAMCATVLALGFVHDGDWASRLMGAFFFAAMWGVVAWAAFKHGWSGLFGVAVAALALRLFIVYFEIFASLAMTGVGLIGAGLLLIVLVLGSRKLFERVQKA